MWAWKASLHQKLLISFNYYQWVVKLLPKWKSSHLHLGIRSKRQWDSLNRAKKGKDLRFSLVLKLTGFDGYELSLTVYCCKSDYICWYFSMITPLILTGYLQNKLQTNHMLILYHCPQNQDELVLTTYNKMVKHLGNIETPTKNVNKTLITSVVQHTLAFVL